MRDYRDKTVVITGAAAGIGAELAAQFAARGARLALSDVDASGLERTVQRCGRLGAEAQGFAVDVADRRQVHEYAERVREIFGPVHVVVNNAGVAVHGRLADTTDADLDWIMGINFWGVVHGTRAFLPHLIASGDGQLANVSSVFGLIAAPKDAAYNASKFAVRGFTESLRQELRLDRAPVTVSCIHPGGIRTGIARTARVAGEDPDAVSALFDRIAFTTPDRAARTIVSGLSRDRARILVGPDAWLIAALPRLFGAHYWPAIAPAARLLGV